jgi:hypothetical protein
MVRIVQSLAILVAISASLIGYLYYAPNSEGIAQMDRIRPIATAMKLTQFVVCIILFILFYNIFKLYREQQPNSLGCPLVFKFYETLLN